MWTRPLRSGACAATRALRVRAAESGRADRSRARVPVRASPPEGGAAGRGGAAGARDGTRAALDHWLPRLSAFAVAALVAAGPTAFAPSGATTPSTRRRSRLRGSWLRPPLRTSTSIPSSASCPGCVRWRRRARRACAAGGGRRTASRRRGRPAPSPPSRCRPRRLVQPGRTRLATAGSSVGVWSTRPAAAVRPGRGAGPFRDVGSAPIAGAWRPVAAGARRSWPHELLPARVARARSATGIYALAFDPEGRIAADDGSATQALGRRKLPRHPRIRTAHPLCGVS
jgi:hypothetical protein